MSGAHQDRLGRAGPAHRARGLRPDPPGQDGAVSIPFESHARVFGVAEDIEIRAADAVVGDDDSTLGEPSSGLTISSNLKPRAAWKRTARISPFIADPLAPVLGCQTLVLGTAWLPSLPEINLHSNPQVVSF